MIVAVSLVVDEVLPEAPIRHWVLSVPLPLRFLFVREPAAMGGVLGIVIRAIGTHLDQKADLTRARAQTRVVTLIQRFDSAPNLNIQFHVLFLGGVYSTRNGQHPNRSGYRHGGSASGEARSPTPTSGQVLARWER